MEKVNLSEKLSTFTAHWDPKIVGKLNGQLVKLVKFEGQFDWHHHEKEDELFLVLKGEFLLQLKTETIKVKEGEFVIVPRGVEHCPYAEKEVHVLLFEPESTVNTGTAVTAKTKTLLDKI